MHTHARLLPLVLPLRAIYVAPLFAGIVVGLASRGIALIGVAAGAGPLAFFVTAVTSFPLPGQSPRTAQRSFASHESDRVLFSSLQVFDYDGDGEDELLVMGHDQTNEGPKDPIGQIVTFKNGAVSLYGPAGVLPFFRVGDVDKDGRPDLVAFGPYRSRVPARCNGTPIVASGPSSLNVAYTLGSVREAKLEAYPAGWWGTRIVRVPFTEGTLVIDLRDPSTKSLVWRSIAREDKSDAAHIEGKLDDMVRKAIDKYPPKR